MRPYRAQFSLSCFLIVGAILAILLSGCEFLSDGGDDGLPAGEPSFRPVVVPVNTVTDYSSALSATEVSAAGATVVVVDPSSPIAGLSIEIPAGAVPEGESITLSVSEVSYGAVEGLPEGTDAVPRGFRVEATGSDAWNAYATFQAPIRVTLPLPEYDGFVSWYVVSPDGGLEPTGLDVIDRVAGTYSFWTRTLGDATLTVPGFDDEQADDGSTLSQPLELPPGLQSAIRNTMSQNFVAIGIRATTVSQWTNLGFSTDTGFRPSQHAWRIPNYGSYYQKSRGGNCQGMILFASWYHSTGQSPTLFSNYRDGASTATWLDDEVAIELASRAHNAVPNTLSYWWPEIRPAQSSWRDMAMSVLGGLYVANRLVPLLIFQVVDPPGGGERQWNGGHMVGVYAADITATGISFRIYDPNKNAVPESDAVRIEYRHDTGYQQYLSGTDARNSAFRYNWFGHVGYYLGLSHSVAAELKRMADGGFAGNSVFPTIALQSITGASLGDDVLLSIGEDEHGLPAYTTADTAITIQGAVTGGLAQDPANRVDNVTILLEGQEIQAAVDATGVFRATIPLQSGRNQIVFLAASAADYRSLWAGFEQVWVESTAAVADLTVTLSWGQGASDVDLYVREPGAEGISGDTVYYSHRRGFSEVNPYLDFDNTSGFGPEHYIARQGTSTLRSDGSANPEGIFGDYLVKVHYYADHDENAEEIQPISWTLHWRYLAFCAPPCADPEVDGIWSEGSESGSLGAANSGSAHNIDNAGPEWSEGIVIPYARPSLEDWTIPESHEVMLP
jgi:uncharacterized protein YfaP (DUF2135 family)